MYFVYLKKVTKSGHKFSRRCLSRIVRCRLKKNIAVPGTFAGNRGFSLGQRTASEGRAPFLPVHSVALDARYQIQRVVTEIIAFAQLAEADLVAKPDIALLEQDVVA